MNSDEIRRAYAAAGPFRPRGWPSVRLCLLLMLLSAAAGYVAGAYSI